MTTVEKILDLARSKGISESKLADLLCIQEFILYDWKRKIREPTIQHIILISEYFNVTTDYLLKDE